MMHSKIRGLMLEADLTQTLHNLIDALVPNEKEFLGVRIRPLAKRVLITDWQEVKRGIIAQKKNLREVLRLIEEIEKEDRN